MIGIATRLESNWLRKRRPCDGENDGLCIGRFDRNDMGNAFRFWFVLAWLAALVVLSSGFAAALQLSAGFAECGR